MKLNRYVMDLLTTTCSCFFELWIGARAFFERRVFEYSAHPWSEI